MQYYLKEGKKKKKQKKTGHSIVIMSNIQSKFTRQTKVKENMTHHQDRVLHRNGADNGEMMGLAEKDFKNFYKYA